MTAQRPGWLELLGARASAGRGQVDSPWRPPVGLITRPSAVLVLFGQDDPLGDPYVLVLERAATLRFHPGQIAFPGGATDPEDADVVETALREATEEVGLDAAGVQVVATMPSRWIAVSNYLVTPVIAWWEAPHEVSPVDGAEVARVERLTISELADPSNRLTVRYPTGRQGPAFRTRDMFVWGFTAGVLETVINLGGWERPWSGCPVEDLRMDSNPTVR